LRRAFRSKARNLAKHARPRCSRRRGSRSSFGVGSDSQRRMTRPYVFASAFHIPTTVISCSSRSSSHDEQRRGPSSANRRSSSAKRISTVRSVLCRGKISPRCAFRRCQCTLFNNRGECGYRNPRLSCPTFVGSVLTASRRISRGMLVSASCRINRPARDRCR